MKERIRGVGCKDAFGPKTQGVAVGGRDALAQGIGGGLAEFLFDLPEQDVGLALAMAFLDSGTLDGGDVAGNRGRGKPGTDRHGCF